MLACELAKTPAFGDDDSCRLPKRLQSINREGMSAVVLDPFTFLHEGGFGIYEIDTFVNTENLTLLGTLPIAGPGTNGDLAVGSTDGRFVYATFDAGATRQGGVARVDLASGTVTAWPYPGVGRPHGVYYSKTDIPGLNIEAETLREFIEIAEELAPQMREANVPGFAGKVRHEPPTAELAFES